VPIPLNTSGDKLTTPLGGETLDIGAGGSSAQQQAAWEWVRLPYAGPARRAGPASRLRR
jgi:hypothetical protein